MDMSMIFKSIIIVLIIFLISKIFKEEKWYNMIKWYKWYIYMDWYNDKYKWYNNIYMYIHLKKCFFELSSVCTIGICIKFV